MIEILQFIFSSFWVWLGFAILLGIATEGALRVLVVLMTALRGR